MSKLQKMNLKDLLRSQVNISKIKMTRTLKIASDRYDARILIEKNDVNLLCSNERYLGEIPRIPWIIYSKQYIAFELNLVGANKEIMRTNLLLERNLPTSLCFGSGTQSYRAVRKIMRCLLYNVLVLTTFSS